LYVEDNELVRIITSEILAHPTRQITAVASAEEALSVFEPDAFDIVVTDVSLPAMSGLDFARQLLQRAPGIPIVIATGYPLDGSDAALGSLVRVIIKPFEQGQLDEVIDSLRDIRRV
jgi:CheY-like chemotaxis protein